MTDFSPREIVSELDRFIVGQKDAKRAVAIALRNRWRRLRLEAKLEQYPGQLMRACVELAKDWRTDRYLRRLEAMMLVADAEAALVLTGTGDVLEPESTGDGSVMGIGSGGNYALAAGRALLATGLDAEAIARRALEIAAGICVYTNDKFVLESIASK